jgi:hypothetical protein
VELCQFKQLESELHATHVRVSRPRCIDKSNKDFHEYWSCRQRRTVLRATTPGTVTLCSLLAIATVLLPKTAILRHTGYKHDTLNGTASALAGLEELAVDAESTSYSVTTPVRRPVVCEHCHLAEPAPDRTVTEANPCRYRPPVLHATGRNGGFRAQQVQTELPFIGVVNVPDYIQFVGVFLCLGILQYKQQE